MRKLTTIIIAFFFIGILKAQDNIILKAQLDSNSFIDSSIYTTRQINGTMEDYEMQSGYVIDVIEFDSCEYLQVTNYKDGLFTIGAFVHKGNCKFCKARLK